MKWAVSTLCLTFCIVCLFGFGLRRADAATTWYVDDDAPADFNTIQAAIDAASDGDTIIVRDGAYTGDGNRDIDFNGKAVHLRSENGPDNCIIDCQGTIAEPHRGFNFHSGEDQDSIVDGFTIKAGYADGSTWKERSGGGIYCNWYSSPTITNNTITGNTASVGGGISCRNNSSPIITTTPSRPTRCQMAAAAYTVSSPRRGSPTTPSRPTRCATGAAAAYTATSPRR